MFKFAESRVSSAASSGFEPRREVDTVYQPEWPRRAKPTRVNLILLRETNPIYHLIALLIGEMFEIGDNVDGRKTEERVATVERKR